MKINEKNLCVFATTPPYDKEGFLYKRGEVNKAFQKRYFVLKGNLLFYFEKKGDKEPLGLIIVEGCTIELSEESDQYWFEIAFNGNRTYILQAESQESMESWMKALTCAGYEYKKLMVDELQRQLEEIEGSRNKITTETVTNSSASLTPKPPPRRTNPFNRPAPPIPGHNGGTNGNNDTNMPFINGHFGSSSQRNSQMSHETSPVAPPRGMPPTSHFTTGAISTARSEFYVPTQTIQPLRQQQQQPAANKHLNANLASIAVLKPSLIDLQNHNKAINFEDIHEQFRQLVMKDVLAYQAQREVKRRPLIEL
ncbi:inositol phosphatase interacting protein [Musca autumnalis]|uniref:inositol phosphatase interacting protein n=1 Tax=Musca autumnalis TaxID=221902 RepID=UPI003CF2E8C0